MTLKFLVFLSPLVVLATPALASDIVKAWGIEQSFSPTHDQPQVMATDEDGNVYVGGHMDGIAGNSTLFIAKYDKHGKFIARSDYTASLNLANISAMQYDGNGHLYAAGVYCVTPNIISGYDWIMLKIDVATMNFSPSWADTGNGTGIRTFHGTPAQSDVAYDLAIGPNGNIFVTGSYASSKLATIQMTPTGAMSANWANVGDGVGVRVVNNSGAGWKLGFDSAGNAYVGIKYNGNNFDIGVIKYNSAGTLSATWPDAGHGVGFRVLNEAGRQDTSEMDVDSAGNVYICGYGTTWHVLKWGPTGTLLWNNTMPGASDCYWFVRNPGQGVYALGVVDGIVRVARLSESTGVPTGWPNLGSGVGIRDMLPGEGNLGDIALDSSENLYVSSMAATNHIARIRCIDSNGDMKLVDEMHADSDLWFYLLEAGREERMYAAGSLGNFGSANSLLNKYMPPNVFGTAGLGQFQSGDPSTIPVSIEIRDERDVLSTIVGVMDRDMRYMAATEYTGSYQVGVKPSHWLRQTISGVTFDLAGTEIGETRHANGDIDGDNEVSIGDFSRLSNAYGTFEGDLAFDPEADLTGDGGVDIGDFAILSSNYGQVGDD